MHFMRTSKSTLQMGAPVEGLYVTQKDGTLLYSYKTPNPTTTLGFSTNFSYKKWNLFVAMHGDIGNYMYNNMLSKPGY